MKVTDIKTFAVDCFRTNWVFIKVYTDEGIDGVGEATLQEPLALRFLMVRNQKHAAVRLRPHRSPLLQRPLRWLPRLLLLLATRLPRSAAI